MFLRWCFVQDQKIKIRKRKKKYRKEKIKPAEKKKNQKKKENLRLERKWICFRRVYIHIEQNWWFVLGDFPIVLGFGPPVRFILPTSNTPQTWLPNWIFIVRLTHIKIETFASRQLIAFIYFFFNFFVVPLPPPAPFLTSSIQRTKKK